jgi:outer membrane murein-binding lipoprotein Lpp
MVCGREEVFFCQFGAFWSIIGGADGLGIRLTLSCEISILLQLKSHLNTQTPHSSIRRVLMNKHTRTGTSLGVALLLAGSLVLAGCTSKPDEAEMKQLNDLKAEVASLQKEIAAKDQAKAALEKEVAEKNAKLKKCADDQAVVKQRLANK